MNPLIIDTTLRDGEQAPGVAFSTDDKLRIATLLDKLGVDEVEAGTPAIGLEEQESIRQIASAGFSFVTSCWCRANIADIQLTASLGTQSINISLPASDIQIETLGKSRQWVLTELKKSIVFARSNFPHVTMGAQDASRADINFLKEFIFLAHDSGAQRIRLSDTVGIYDPMETGAMIKEMRREFPEIPFEFHAHNDLGMATANAVSALQSGAQVVSATVNGLGERAGNASLEEIIAILKYKKNIQRFDTSQIATLSILVSQLSNSPIPADKPLTGVRVFTHESGIHTSALLKNLNTYQFLNPEDFGHLPMHFTFGKHSGRAALKDFFKAVGIRLLPSESNRLLQIVKMKVSKLKRDLNEAELIELHSRFIEQEQSI